MFRDKSTQLSTPKFKMLWVYNSLLKSKFNFLNKYIFLVAVLIAGLSLRWNHAQAVEQAPIQILVSIEPLAMMTKSLIPVEQKSLWDIQTLVPRTSSTHEYQMKPSDILKMKNANTFLWLGHHAEPVFAQAAARFVSHSVELEQADVHWLHFGPGQDDGHHHEEGAVDPHIWLSLPQIPNMLKFVEHILEQRLDAATSEFSADEIKNMKSQIKQQLQLQLKEHQALMLRIQTLNQAWSYKRYISFHNAFAYLDEGIGVQSLGSFVQNPEDGVAPRQLQKLKRAMKSSELGCAFLEPSAKGRRIETLLPKGFKVVELDILGALMSEETTWSEYWNAMVSQMDVCFGSPAMN